MTDLPPDIPAYAYIKRELKNQIESGELAEGDRVPSEFELARMYNVSRNPTRQALRDLELEGYIVRSPGRGSFVAPAGRRQRLLHVNGWHTVALACPELECRYTRQVVQGFIQAAAEQGYQAMVYFLLFSDESEFSFLADMRNSGVEGLAFWLQHPSERTLDLLRKFRKSNFAYVLIDRFVRGLEADFVVSNNEDMGYRLTQALLDHGHSEIAFVTCELDNTSGEDRFSGYRRALKAKGLPFAEDMLGIFNPKSEPISVVVSRIMARRARPTAFVCGNDGVAANLIDELNDLGYSVPKDVEVAAVDDNQLAEALDLPMVTAAQAGLEMGRESARILLQRIADPNAPVQQRFLKATIHTEYEESPAQDPAASELGGQDDRDTEQPTVQAAARP